MDARIVSNQVINSLQISVLKEVPSGNFNPGVNFLLKNISMVVDDIDAGNSNITEGEAIEIVDNLRRFTDKEKRLSKYAACKYLNVSRATFDNYVRSGKLPRGEHEAGFKELSWNKKTLDEFIRRSKHEK